MKLPTYREHKGSGQAVMEHDGNRTYLGRYNSPASRRKFRALVQEILTAAGVAEEEPDLADVRYVGELVAAFRLDMKPPGKPAKLSERDYGHFLYACDHLLKAEISKGTTGDAVLLADFKPRDLEKVRDSMIAAGWTRKYVNRQTGRIRQVFKWGVTKSIVPVAVFNALKTIDPLRRGKGCAAPEAPPIKPVPDDIIDATLPYTGRVVAAMIQLQRLAGMRPQDICRVKPAEIDKSEEVWFYIPPEHKGTWMEKERIVFFGPRCQKILAPFLDRPADAFCFSPVESERERSALRRANRKTKVQPSQAARRPKAKSKRPRKESYSVDSYRQAIHYAVKKANREQPRVFLPVPFFAPLQIRHTAGTSIRKTHGLEASQIMLGHSKADVTQIYAERNLELGRKVARETG